MDAAKKREKRDHEEIKKLNQNLFAAQKQATKSKRKLDTAEEQLKRLKSRRGVPNGDNDKEQKQKEIKQLKTKLQEAVADRNVSNF